MPTMPSRPSSGAVASRHDAATSPSDDETAAPPVDPSRPGPVRSRPTQQRPRIVVSHAGAAPGAESSGSLDGVVPLDYPVQLSKVQAPPLREDTLARERLLDWLSVKIHSRVVL